MRLRVIIVAAAAAALAGCGPSGGCATTAPAKPAGSSAKVDTAAAIAREMQANPDQSDQVFQKHGMTEQQFEDLMYEIASDPVMSEQYANKVGK